MKYLINFVVALVFVINTIFIVDLVMNGRASLVCLLATTVSFGLFGVCSYVEGRMNAALQRNSKSKE